jgi:hypothetical protein
MLNELEDDGIPRGFLGEDVQSSARAMAGFKGVEKRLLVDDAAPRHVYDAYAPFALVQGRGINQI